MHTSSVKTPSRTLRNRRRGNAAYIEFLEARVLFSFSGTSVGGTWSYAGMDASGTVQLDTAGDIIDGSLTHADGSQTVPSGTYTIGPVSGTMRTYSNNDTKSGAITSSLDLIALNTPGQNIDFSNSLTLLVRHDFVTYSNADLNGSWQLFLNGDDADSTSIGAISFDSNGDVTGGISEGASGTATITGGNYTLSDSGQVTAIVDILKPDLITTGSKTLTGWLNSHKDTLVLNPADLPASAAGGGTRLFVGVHEALGSTNADLHGTWEFLGDGFKGAMTFDGAGHLSGLGVNSDGSAMALTGTYALASDGTFTAALTVTNSLKSDDLSFSGALNAGHTFAAMSQVPFNNGTDSSEDSLMVLVNSGGLTATRGVAGDWTFGGTDLQGSLSFDDASVPPTGTNSTDSTGNILGGSLTDTNDQSNPASGTYTLSSENGIQIINGGEARVGSYNSSNDVIAVNRLDADDTLSVLVSGGTATFSNADLNGSWVIEFNGTTPDSNGGGTVTFDGEGGVTGGTLVTGTTRISVNGGNYALNGDGTFASLNVDLEGAGTLSFTGAMNAQKDVLSLSPTDPQAAAANQMPNLTLLVRSAGTYTNASITGKWFFEDEGGHGSMVLDGAGHITSGSHTDTSNNVSAFTGTYAVKPNGTFTAVFHVGAQTLNLAGAINASRNVMIENATGSGQSGNLTVFTTATNHAPTITAIAPLNLAVVGQSFPISYATLLAASNAVDVDGDPLTFKITALGTGTLTINGSPATVGATVSSFDTLAWLPPAGAGGTFTAFSVAVTNGTTSSAAVPVTINAIPTSGYSTGDINNFWNLQGEQEQGSIALDGAGNVTGGLVTDDTGGSDVPSGTYTVGDNGSVAFIDDPASPATTGAMNATRDVVAISNRDGGMDVLINSQNVLFSNADLNGTWTMSVNGDTSDSNGVGSMTFNGAGLITGGKFTNGKGSKPLTGTYTVNADGTLVFNILNTHDNGTPGTLTLQGAMNGSKDFIAVDPTDLAAAAAKSDSNLIVMVHAVGAYTNADAKGTWEITGDHSTGYVTFDGAGHVVNGFINDKGKLRTITGTYAVTATGAWTFDATTNTNGQLRTQTFTGSLNKSRNLIVMNFPSADTNNTGNTVMLINSADHAPTLKTVTPFATAIGTQPFTMSYSQLLVASAAADLDGDTVQFQVTSIGAGTLKLNSVAAPAVPFLVSSGDILEWTPLATAKGNVTAFSIKAFDGLLASATTVPVVVTTVLPPTISIVASRPTASELHGQTTAFGQFTITRTNGDKTKPLTVDYTITGTAINGTDYTLIGGSVNFTAGQTTALVQIRPSADTLLEGTQNVVLTLATDSQLSPTYLISTTKRTATVNITDVLPTPTALTGALKNTPFNFTYTDLFNALGAQSEVSPLGPMIFKIVSIKAGTLKINGTTAKAKSTIGGGDTLTWTPPHNVTGTKAAFTLTVTDTFNTSAPVTIMITIV